MTKLRDRVAIVTGAARGIGRARAERPLAKGAKVVLADIDRARLDETVAEIGGTSEAHGIVCDVSIKADVEALVAATVARFGGVDIMFNNAGIAMMQNFLDVSEADYDRVLSVNLKGAVMGTQAAARQMIAHSDRALRHGGQDCRRRRVSSFRRRLIHHRRA